MIVVVVDDIEIYRRKYCTHINTFYIYTYIYEYKRKTIKKKKNKIK